MSLKKRKSTLILTTSVALFAVLSLGVSTFAWFQANADVNIVATSEEATITVSAPESVKFYYFKGNGTAGTNGYTGYSKKNASYGNTTNIIGIDETASSGSDNSGKFSTDGGTNYLSMSTFADTWTEIHLGTASEVQNAFNFSKMRAGCYYSFMIETNLATTTVTASYDWENSGAPTKGITGDNTSPKRYLSGGGTNPINLLMAINGYCSTFSSKDNATSYINNTVGIANNLGLTDLISFTTVAAAGAKTESYTLLNAATTSTNKYIYFTIFMGGNNDAYQYVSTENSIDYYAVNANGTYSVFDGLRSTLVSIAVS